MFAARLGCRRESGREGLEEPQKRLLRGLVSWRDRNDLMWAGTGCACGAACETGAACEAGAAEGGACGGGALGGLGRSGAWPPKMWR